MPQHRAPHSKSRYGCMQCKQRRLKCDETRPICQRCEQSNKQCSFLDQAGPSNVAANDFIANVDDMFLLHNFIVSSRSFSFDGEAHEVSHDDPISIAFTKQYLLHAILGLSALQIYAEDRSQTRRYRQAMSHQDAAIRQAKPHLAHILPVHAEALWWFSSYTSLFALAEPPLRPQGERVNFDPISELLHAFSLSRRIKSISAQLPQASGLSKAIEPENWKDNRGELKPKLRTNYRQLSQLETFIKAKTAHAEAAKICLEHAEELFLFIALLENDPANKKLTHLIPTWSMNLNHEFLDMCKDRQVSAVAILAYYAVAIHTRQNVWFFRGWSALLLEECERLLRDELVGFEDLLAWPKRTVFGVSNDEKTKASSGRQAQPANARTPRMGMMLSGF